MGELDAEERRLRERQQALNERLMDQERTLQELRARRDADQAELDRLSSRLQALEAEQQRLGAARPAEVDPAELERLEAENQELERALDQMLQSLPG
jgi:chromosome segregation ATPase